MSPLPYLPVDEDPHPRTNPTALGTVMCGSRQQTSSLLALKWRLQPESATKTFDEDRSRVRTASGPRIMASLRNLVITILRPAGTTSIAAPVASQARGPDVEHRGDADAVSEIVACERV
jgi:hypothetical protein